MKQIVSIFCFLLLAVSAFSQGIVSGHYNDALQLAFDSATKEVTGYYSSCTGWNDKVNAPQFSCSFYLQGFVTDNEFRILTFFPDLPKNIDDTIYGTMEIVNDSTVKIKLNSEHDGCWNVEHFADKLVEFTLDKKQPWNQIRFVAKEKAYFYNTRSEDTRRKAYLVHGDLVYIDDWNNSWTYQVFKGKRVTKGWIKLSDLNKL